MFIYNCLSFTARDEAYKRSWFAYESLRVIIYRVSQEERSIFWEVIVLAILSKNVYMNVSYSERFAR